MSIDVVCAGWTPSTAQAKRLSGCRALTWDFFMQEGHDTGASIRAERGRLFQMLFQFSVNYRLSVSITTYSPTDSFRYVLTRSGLFPWVISCWKEITQTGKYLRRAQVNGKNARLFAWPIQLIATCFQNRLWLMAEVVVRIQGWDLKDPIFDRALTASCRHMIISWLACWEKPILRQLLWVC